MVEILKEKGRNVDFHVSSLVSRIVTLPDHVEVFYYSADGQFHRVNAQYVVFAAQLKLAPQIIKNFSTLAPEQFEIIQNLKYSDYSVHGVHIAGNPFKKSYDTWFRPTDYSEDDPSDIISGRWMEQNSGKTSTNGSSILTIYHPFRLDQYDGGWGKPEAIRMAKRDVSRLIETFSPISDGPIEVKSVETSRWPISMHLAQPGHFIKYAKVLRRPVGRIFFASNNVGMPSIDEVVYRAHCAANNVLARLVVGFKPEKWSNCTITPDSVQTELLPKAVVRPNGQSKR